MFAVLGAGPFQIEGDQGRIVPEGAGAVGHEVARISDVDGLLLVIKPCGGGELLAQLGRRCCSVSSGCSP